MLKGIARQENLTKEIDVTTASGSIEGMTFPEKALGVYVDATPLTDSVAVVSAIIGMTTHVGPGNGSGNQHNLGVLGMVDNAGTLGSEELANTSFDTDTDWTKQAGWTISGGSAVAAAGSASSIFQTLANVEFGAWYEVTFTIANYSAGVVAPLVGDTAVGSYRSANGTYTEVIQAAGSNKYCGLFKDSTFVGEVTDISIKTVTSVVGAYAVEGRIQHTGGYTSTTACFIAAAQTVAEGADGLVTVHADFLSNDFSDHAYMASKFTLLNNDEDKILRSKGAIDGFKCTIIEETGTSFTLSHATHGGRTVMADNASTITVTVPNSVPLGFVTEIHQKGLGEVVYSQGSGATLNPANNLQSDAQWAVTGLKTTSNADGTSSISTVYGAVI